MSTINKNLSADSWLRAIKILLGLGCAGLLLIRLLGFVNSFTVNLGYLELAKSLIVQDRTYITVYELVRKSTQDVAFVPQNLAEAERYFNKVTENIPGYQPALVGSSRANWVRGEYTAAFDILKQLTPDIQNNVPVLFLAGHASAMIGNDPEAVSFWKRAASTSVEGQLLLVNILRQNKMYADAMELADEIINTSSNYQHLASAHGLLAETILYTTEELSDDEIDLAASHLKKAIDLDPDNSEWHTWLSTAYLRQGAFSDSVAEARLAIDLSPYSRLAHYNLAEAYMKLDDVENAVIEYNEALKYARTVGDQQWILLQLGDAYFFLDQKEMAIRQWQKALELNPNFWQAAEKIKQAEK